MVRALLIFGSGCVVADPDITPIFRISGLLLYRGLSNRDPQMAKLCRSEGMLSDYGDYAPTELQPAPVAAQH
jgi:hypothetical protein